MDAYVFDTNEDLGGARFVQALNPDTGRYVKVDRLRGKIVAYRQDEGPYKNLPIVEGKKKTVQAGQNDETLSQFRGNQLKL